MKRQHAKTAMTPLEKRYPPSDPCSCEICLSFCQRPGWWTVNGASDAIEAGYGLRMMLEMAPENTFGVLAPAFKGCEGNFALDCYSNQGCTFLQNSLCELHGTGFQPLECRFCHHDRQGLGDICHSDIEKDWNTPEGRSLVVQWSKITGFWKRHIRRID